MPLFTWKEHYSVGVAELDEHHRTLFAIVNRLYDECVKPDGRCDLTVHIAELGDYTRYHFGAEEQFMECRGYAGLAAHAALHRLFVERLDRLQREYGEAPEEATRELIILAGNWLLHHVLEEDRKYAPNGTEPLS